MAAIRVGARTYRTFRTASRRLALDSRAAREAETGIPWACWVRRTAKRPAYLVQPAAVEAPPPWSRCAAARVGRSSLAPDSGVGILGDAGPAFASRPAPRAT